MIGLLFIPIIFFRRYDNDTCNYVPGPNGIDSLTYIAFRGYTWLLFQYIIPVFIITISHLLIIIKLKKRQYQPKILTPIEVSVSNTLRNKGYELNKEKKLIKLVLITAIMSGQQATLHLYESIRYFLTMLNIVIYSYGTIGQQMGPFLIILSSCINPCIIIGTTVSVRRRFSYYLHEIWIKIKRDNVIQKERNSSVQWLYQLSDSIQAQYHVDVNLDVKNNGKKVHFITE
ncbi:G-protein coupled receptor fragment, putative [Schistosoma mansoni]|uniref:G-protein coupled receptor fragment, putative n=1 Tax=Schistosoma mansoni TaxID=6183 RepID=UPI0001A63178|nr:G-protein coupled receptor fragment, putative [Schistosoma mansoni]